VAGRLLLASRSPIRLELLARAGLAVEAVPSAVDERALEAEWGALAPHLAARRLAEAKALDVSAKDPDAIVIGADQTLALGAERFSKAKTLAEARERLKRLAGRTHQLHSGFAVAAAGKPLASGVSSAALTMRPFSDAFLDDYLDHAGDSVLGSVGCYQLEGLGVTLFSAIEGDYFTILGLPLLAVLDALRAVGALKS
jgi:septum formation protein